MVIISYVSSYIQIVIFLFQMFDIFKTAEKFEVEEKLTLDNICIK